MNVKKAIKKVVALGVGVSMMGATLLGATANPGDFSEYPSPFVKDGVFNGLMVVGDDAAPADIIGVTDIAMSLQYSSTIKETIKVSGDSGVSLGGDSVKFERSGDVLELREWLGAVIETMDSADAEALKTFTVSNDKGTTDVNQYLRFNWDYQFNSTNQKLALTVDEDTAAGRALYTKDEDDNVGDFLWFEDGDSAFQYELEFVEGFESDVVDNDLDDLEDETLHILGEDFAVVNTAYSAAGRMELDLMGGAIHDTLEEGETKTYTLKGKEYEVTALIVSDWAGAAGDAKVKLKVNGEVTKEMSEGSTEILNDGTSIGIREVLPNEAGETSGGDILEFYLGAFKLKFTDTENDFDMNLGTVEVNEETIEDCDMDITWTADAANESVRISKITYKLFTDGSSGSEAYLAPGQGYREFLDEPEGMLADAWDIKYEGLSDPGVTPITFKASGDDEYRMTFTNTQGVEYSNVRLIYANSTGALIYGDDDDTLIFNQDGSNVTNFTKYTIMKNDYFVVSHNGGTDTGVTRILRLDNLDITNSLVQLTDVGTGGTINAQYTGSVTTGTATGDINVGGYSFAFDAYNSTTTGKGQIQLLVDLNDDGDFGDEAGIVTQGGSMIDLGTQVGYRTTVAPGFNLTVTTDNNNFDEAPLVDETFDVTFNITSDQEVDLDVNGRDSIGLDFNTPEDNSDINLGMTDYGALIKRTNEDSGPDSAEISYPLQQLLPQTFVTFEKTVTMEGGAGTITVERPQRIDVGSAVLASQVSDPTALNVISVGGPCINAVTAEIMGLTYPACGADSGLAEGEGLLKLYESGGKVAIVVAGWEAEDTTRATRVLADYKTYQEAGKLVGSEVKVTGTSATEFTVTPVTATTTTATEEVTE